MLAPKIHERSIANGLFAGGKDVAISPGKHRKRLPHADETDLRHRAAERLQVPVHGGRKAGVLCPAGLRKNLQAPSDETLHLEWTDRTLPESQRTVREIYLD